MLPFVLQSEAMRRDAVLNVRLPADVKAAIRCAAKDDFDRSISSMVVRVLREWSVEKGYLTNAPSPSSTVLKKRKRS